MLNIVIFGAPGSGNGTQSARLIDAYGLYHISTGELLRDHIKRGTELGVTADQFISKGQLIPDDLMIRILDDVLENEAAAKKGVVFDGLDVPEDELVHRMLARGKETGRADDNIDTIKNRLDVYHNQTLPLRKYYEEKCKYIAVNGTGIVDEIFANISRQLHDLTGIAPKI